MKWPQSATRAVDLYNLLTKAKAYYQNSSIATLWHSWPGITSARGLTPEIIQQYQIGFAPPEKSNFFGSV